MRRNEKEYLKEHFSEADEFIEISMQNGKETVLIIEDKACKIVNLFIKKDKIKQKYVETHEIIDEFILIPNEKVVKDDFVLSSKYNSNGKIIRITSKESQNKFEEILEKNGNIIENTNRSFFNKIIGFRTKNIGR
ncbi:hypothetical protein [Staphylococcus equorum]|uniref:hypothetical protein n=1 Tax=Staphylococcus equorum TaxID=246432 RepID=UPI002981ABA8|nr:hypothetical protein [Staphylococcus equorum]MDW5472019.1 hypothetical protein [Staphylococcus equorum]